uniref:Uncharacterized protein n=1 Tax=Triticum urartu TaxID=4572 RepID=A0A8R7QYW5_TRIUA
MLVVVEPSLSAEFVMVGCSTVYGALVDLLPEVFVSMSVKLRAVVGDMCTTMKWCDRESSLHMAPWRKRRYMEAERLDTPNRLLLTAGAL